MVTIFTRDLMSTYEDHGSKGTDCTLCGRAFIVYSLAIDVQRYPVNSKVLTGLMDKVKVMSSSDAVQCPGTVS